MKCFTYSAIAAVLLSSAPLFAQKGDAEITVKAKISPEGSSFTVSGWKENKQAWKKVWTDLLQTELASYSPHTIHEGTLYVVVGAELHSIDLATGNQNFTPVNVGSCQHKPMVDEKSGTIYCCGYYGPVITAVTSTGTMMWSYENQDLWWPNEVKLKGKKIKVYHYLSDTETAQVSTFNQKGKLLKTQKR